MNQPNGNPRDVPMPLVEHLRELRKRLIISAVAVTIGFAVAYGFSDRLFALLVKPLNDALPNQHGALIYTGLVEPFMVYLKTGMIGGLLLAMPVILLQIWLFVRPAFRGGEERFTTLFVVAGSIMFIVGAVFGYVFVFPAGFKFFISVGGGAFMPYISIDEYFSLATKMLFAFGVMFETPLVIFLLGRLGVVDGTYLRKHRGIALVAAFTIGAILTPPDPVSQILLSVPLYVLYEGSIWLVSAFGKKRRPAASA